VLDTARETGAATLVGIDPRTEPQVSFIGPGVLSEGRFLEPGEQNAVVVGRALLDDMATELGHKLVIMAQAADGETVSRAFRIVGVFRAELEATEKRFVFVSRGAAREMLALDGAVSEIAVLLDDHERAGAAAEALRRVLAGSRAAGRGLEVRDWRELLPVQRAVLDLFEGFIGLWNLVVFIAMGFGVVNTILMAVFERMREFGLFKALGMRPAAIVGEVLAEAAFLLVLGTIAGNLLGWGSSAALAVHGIDLSAMAAGMELAGLSRVIYPVLRAEDVLLANAVVVLLGVVVSLYPALKAARFTPVEAMSRR
jgi:ABC-type lipoprotein release transport system permease subunit